MGAVVSPLRPPPKAQAPGSSGAGRWPAAHGPAPTPATSAGVISLPRLLPLKIQRPGCSGSRRAPRAKLSGEEKGAESEERGRAGSPASPGLFRPPPRRGLPRLRGVKLQQLLRGAEAPGGAGGGRSGAAETLVEKGSFFSCPCLLHPHRFLQVSPLGTCILLGAWRAGGPAQAQARALCAPHRPEAPQRGPGCASPRGAGAAMPAGTLPFRLGATRAPAH